MHFKVRSVPQIKWWCCIHSCQHSVHPLQASQMTLSPFHSSTGMRDRQGVNFRALKWRCPSLLAVWCAHPRCSRYQVGLSTPRPPMRSPPTTPHVHLRRGFTNRGNFKLDVSPIRKHILIQSCVSLTPRIQEFSRIKAQNQSVIFKKKTVIFFWNRKLAIWWIDVCRQACSSHNSTWLSTIYQVRYKKNSETVTLSVCMRRQR